MTILILLIDMNAYIFLTFIIELYFTCTLPVLYLYYTCTLPVLYLYFTCTMPALYLYFTCTIPVLYLYYTCTLPVHYLYFTCTIPVLYLYFATMKVRGFFKGCRFFPDHLMGNAAEYLNIIHNGFVLSTFMLTCRYGMAVQSWLRPRPPQCPLQVLHTESHPCAWALNLKAGQLNH